MRGRPGRVFLLIVAVSLAAGCAGGRGTLRFQELAYPASLSPVLPGEGSALLRIGAGLEELGSFTVRGRFWGIFYSALPLSGEGPLVEAINAAVREKGGTGIVDMAILVDNGWINYIPGFSLLPVWPGFAEVTVRGRIVRPVPAKLND